MLLALGSSSCCSLTRSLDWSISAREVSFFNWAWNLNSCNFHASIFISNKSSIRRTFFYFPSYTFLPTEMIACVSAAAAAVAAFKHGCWLISKPNYSDCKVRLFWAMSQAELSRAESTLGMLTLKLVLYDRLIFRLDIQLYTASHRQRMHIFYHSSCRNPFSSAHTHAAREHDSWVFQDG